MHVDLTEEQAAALRALIDETVSDLSYEIAATDNSGYRTGLVERRRFLQHAASSLEPVDCAGQPNPVTAERVWTVEVVFTEDDDRTRADARLHGAQRQWHGWGRARRNPLDPDVPAIGEELAAARALSDLSHQLVDAAAHGIETFEGHPVRVHA